MVNFLRWNDLRPYSLVGNTVSLSENVALRTTSLVDHCLS